MSNEPTSGAPSTSAYRIRPRPSRAPRSARGCGPTGPLKVRPRRSGACTPPCSSGSRDPVGSRGQLLWISSFAAASQGDQSAALQSGTEALEIGRSIGDPEVVAWALQALGVTAYLTNRLDEAIAYATETLALARAMGWRFTALSAATLLGVAHTFRGELDEGIAIARDGIRSSEELGETWERAYLLHFLAVALLHKGEPAEAEVHARRCLELKRALGDLIGMASAVEALALIAMSRGSSERSATLLGAGEAIWRSIPTTILEPYRADHDRTEADARAALGTARFRGCPPRWPGDDPRRGGRLRTRGPAVSARVVVGHPEPSDGPLSRREMEVAGLVADGATNAQVAARLFISERTVESHLASIFNKLGVDTRLQVARWFATTQEVRADLRPRSRSRDGCQWARAQRGLTRVELDDRRTPRRGSGPSRLRQARGLSLDSHRFAAARGARGSQR